MLNLVALLALAPSVVPLPRAHAHNDYDQRRPLVGALENGFCSIEADVFPIDGKLLVAHNRDRVTASRELDGMYLKPLIGQIEAHRGHVYEKPTEVTLLVDIKENGSEAYRILKQELAPYHRYLTSYMNGKVKHRALMVVLSGDRPIADLTAEKERWAFIDGRFDDPMPGAADPALTPLVSTAWSDEFKWNGSGSIPDADLTHLRELVSKTHGHGQKIRFWETSETNAMWTVLLENQVDLIGTDLQPQLARFLLGSR